MSIIFLGVMRELGSLVREDLAVSFDNLEDPPSHQTIGRVFSILKPNSFEDFFIAWTATLGGSNAGQQIAIDGKTLRGCYDRASGKQALHLLHAYAVDRNITLAQLEVGIKTNEITTVPQMIAALDVAGAMISVDALNTQKEIAKNIIDAKADYTMALKGNHKNLNEEVAFIFSTKKLPSTKQNHFAEAEKAHGRVTERLYDVIEVNVENLPQKLDWQGLQSVGRVETTDHAPRNYSLVRKFALNIIKTSKGKLSVPLVHIKSAANPDFLTQMLIDGGFKEVA